MTPLEKARAEEGRVNYCDECEQFEIVGNFAYCKVDGKLIHPIMMMRGQGTGPAWNCKKRLKRETNYDTVTHMSIEELAEFLDRVRGDGWLVGVGARKQCQVACGGDCMPTLEWLKQEAE